MRAKSVCLATISALSVVKIHARSLAYAEINQETERNALPSHTSMDQISHDHQQSLCTLCLNFGVLCELCPSSMEQISKE
ncbi:unnamed protein product [Sympodiomycopsis kandeliae]